MTTRADVERLTAAQARLVALAADDLDRLFAALDLSDPVAARNAMLEIVPALVREYGDLAAVAAAEWYEQLRAAEIGGAYAARLGQLAPDAAVAGSVRWSAGHLFTDDPAAMIPALAGAVQRHIVYSGRSTVARNVQLDPARPRFARVPRGPKTCAWCLMLASRGFVYHSARAAGDGPSAFDDDYHDACDCQAVVEFDRDQHHIDGYDPDAWYDMYLAARDATGSGDQRDIAAAMRRMFPDELTDGIHAAA